ncbi:inverse autotransporter beta domain-containing protein [Atlantibacter hermannii]|uniref:inverse autotransporter beta domain-containing protein n=1 Tax=Atlantibacter hermannii TaxID=565 RepID=UPI0034D642A2
MGLGLEYGRDYLKLSANNYQRLTGWKDSKDFDDYQERVANGWDVRAEGWLPAYPQLGMKLVYEQYYGNEVALFDKDDRQKDPHAVTVGVNYTPVPLLTLSAGQREGKADDSETRVGLQMNYQLGVPWMHQVDPDSVAALRTLTGSRYDLVDRNNNIILEYRKKEVIRLHTTDLITGNGGEQKSSGVAVNSKYGVKQVDWSAPALIAAGGKIVSNSPTNYDVVLPAWQSGNGAVNTYTVTGVAVDNKGNRSSESETQVTVNAAEISVLYSTFTPESPLSSSTTDSYLPADGVSSEVMTLTLLDEQKQPVDVPLEDINLTTKFTTRSSSSSGLRAQPEVDATVSALTRKSSGVYEATVTAGTKVELVTITPSVRKTTLSAARVFIIKKAPNGGQSTFTASPKTVAADGIAASTLTLTAKDVAGNILPGIAGNLSVSVVDSHNGIPAADKITVSSMTETATPSIYTATIKSSLVDTLTIKPRFNGIQLGALSAAVEFVPGAFKNVTVKDYVFSNSAGFPTTTFNGANFTPGTPDGKNASDYTWTSS